MQNGKDYLMLRVYLRCVQWIVERESLQGNWQAKLAHLQSIIVQYWQPLNQKWNGKRLRFSKRVIKIFLLTCSAVKILECITSILCQRYFKLLTILLKKIHILEITRFILWKKCGKKMVHICETECLNSYWISNKSFTAASLVLLLLAPDVVESKEQVVALCQTSWKSQLYFFIEVWWSEKKKN